MRVEVPHGIVVPVAPHWPAAGREFSLLLLGPRLIHKGLGKQTERPSFISEDQIVCFQIATARMWYLAAVKVDTEAWLLLFAVSMASSICKAANCRWLLQPNQSADPSCPGGYMIPQFG